MSLAKGLRKIILRLSGDWEPTYKMFFSLDVPRCEAYWREFYNFPIGYHPLISSSCRADRQIYILFDCHGDPMVPTTEMPYGHYLPIYWPDAAWAQGKWAIYSSYRTHYPHGELWPLHNEVDIVKRCCPQDWIDEIVGSEGVPG